MTKEVDRWRRTRCFIDVPVEKFSSTGYTQGRERPWISQLSAATRMFGTCPSCRRSLSWNMPQTHEEKKRLFPPRKTLGREAIKVTFKYSRTSFVQCPLFLWKTGGYCCGQTIHYIIDRNPSSTGNSLKYWQCLQSINGTYLPYLNKTGKRKGPNDDIGKMPLRHVAFVRNKQ